MRLSSVPLSSPEDHRMESCSFQRRHMRSLASSSSPSASFFPFLFSLFSLTLYIIPFSSPNPHSFPLCVNAVFLHHVFILPICPELPSLFPLVFQKCHLLLFIFPKCPPPVSDSARCLPLQVNTPDHDCDGVI